MKVIYVSVISIVTAVGQCTALFEYLSALGVQRPLQCVASSCENANDRDMLRRVRPATARDPPLYTLRLSCLSCPGTGSQPLRTRCGTRKSGTLHWSRVPPSTSLQQHGCSAGVAPEAACPQTSNHTLSTQALLNLYCTLSTKYTTLDNQPHTRPIHAAAVWLRSSCSHESSPSTNHLAQRKPGHLLCSLRPQWQGKGSYCWSGQQYTGRSTSQSCFEPP
jgi:hypothetical protein